MSEIEQARDTGEVFEIAIPHREPATIVAWRSREEWEEAVARDADSRGALLEEFIAHDPACGEQDTCNCPVDWEAVAAHDLHAWALVNLEELLAVAAGTWQLSRHQDLRVQSLACTLIAERAHDAAESLYTQPEALADLARDANPDVRQAVAGNPSTPAKVRAILARDEHADVRDAARRVRNTGDQAQ